MQTIFRPVPARTVKLLPSLFQQRAELNYAYVMSLQNQNLLQNYYLEAGLWSARNRPEDIHWGWEAPTCQLRGHFLGHWLSAAARLYANTGDAQVKAKADFIVAELARCQQENGGGWAGSIPEKYLDWIAHGKSVWAPQYTVHKTLMGLYEMAAYAGNEQALDVLSQWAEWFYRWTAQFSRDELDDILDVETGGMLEVWADLYGLTGKAEHLELIHRYDRPRLFERLLAGEDPLTNRHANTTIPEAHGAARAYEVTGDQRWRDIAEAYWRSAVTDRGVFCTGSETTGEVWNPPFAFAARLGDKNQEHCVVYNMMRLADYLLRWTGDVTYADYWERNLYNGILAQQNPETGMVTYFLPLEAGSVKTWGTPTHDFWCCHGSLVQAHTIYGNHTYYENDAGLVVSQYIPTELAWQWEGAPVTVKQTFDTEASMPGPRTPDGETHRPNRWSVEFAVRSERPATFALQVRVPWWTVGEARVWVNGEAQTIPASPSSFVALRRTWQGSEKVRVEFPKGLWSSPMPDEPDTVAFMDGPVVLAGLCDEERALVGDKDHPETILTPHNEREWWFWRPAYRARGQERGLRFVPLYEVQDERYTLYFPIRQK